MKRLACTMAAFAMVTCAYVTAKPEFADALPTDDSLVLGRLNSSFNGNLPFAFGPKAGLTETVSAAPMLPLLHASVTAEIPELIKDIFPGASSSTCSSMVRRPPKRRLSRVEFSSSSPTTGQAAESFGAPMGRWPEPSALRICRVP
jgi:hypothetical protein